MDYGKIHRLICSIAITSDDQHLFTGGVEDNGHVKQISVRHGKMIKDYGTLFKSGLLSMTITPDNNYLFAASYRGHLKQISLESQQVVHDYGEIHYDRI